MPRRARISTGGLAYHILNRRVGRLGLFDKPAFSVILVICCLIASCSDEPRFAIEARAKKQFAALPGKIGVTFKNYAGKWYLLIERGNLSLVGTLPEAPKEATSRIGPFGAENLVAPDNYDYFGPYSVSPDGRFVVASLATKNPFSTSPTAFVIVDFRTKRPISKVIKIGNYEVGGFAWSPDSKEIAMLKYRGRFKWWRPVDFISALSGHPIPYAAFHLAIVDLQGNTIAETSLVGDLPAPMPEVIWTE
jgi:hypothetical protein